MSEKTWLFTAHAAVAPEAIIMAYIPYAEHHAQKSTDAMARVVTIVLIEMRPSISVKFPTATDAQKALSDLKDWLSCPNESVRFGPSECRRCERLSFAEKVEPIAD